MKLLIFGAALIAAAFAMLIFSYLDPTTLFIGGTASDCADEVALLHERVLPGGSVFLFYDATRPEQVPIVVEKASAALQSAGFRISVVEQKAPAVVGIIGKR